MIKKIIDWAETQLKSSLVAEREVHGDRSKVFRLYDSSDNYFLKTGQGLKKEYDRLEWAIKKLPVPKVLGFTKIDGKEALLLSAIGGKNLKVLSREWPAEKVVDELAKALRKFHSVDISSCPFGTYKKGNVLVHGDACLPNFIFQDKNFSGYIDLGDMEIGSPEIDFSAAIWSLQYNLGPGYGVMFLKKYGVDNVTEEFVEKLRLKYEDMQEEWGL